MLGNYGRSVPQKLLTPAAKVLAKLHLTPNLVTSVGTLCAVVASIGFFGTGHLWVGAIVVAVVLFADSLDGILARLAGSSSAFGAFLDSTLDRIADGAVFGALLYWVIVGFEPTLARTTAIIAGIICMSAISAVPYARARAESIGVSAKIGIAERTDRLMVILLCALIQDLSGLDWVLTFGFVWVAFASLVTVGQRIWLTYRELVRK